MKLRTRILLGCLVVPGVTAGLTAWLTRIQTIAAIEVAASANLETDQAIFDDLFDFALEHGGWSSVGERVNELGATYDRRIALFDLDGTAIADTDPGAPLPEDGRLLDAGFVFATDVGTACFEALEVDSDEPQEVCADAPPGLDEGGEAFDELAPVSAVVKFGYSADALVDFGSLGAGQIFAIAGAGLLAAIAVAALVASTVTKPLVALTRSIDRIGAGSLAERVEVSGGEAGVLADRFNAMAARLEQADDTRRRMVSDVAHELRNPVGVLRANIEAAQDGIFPLDDELLALLHDESMHMASIIQDLQQLALADAGELAISVEEINLVGLAESVSSWAEPLAQARQVSLVVVSDSDEVVALADPRRMRQVLLNLVGNAVRHTSEGTTVSIEVRRTEAEAVLSVADEGPGLEQDQLDKVFDRFWRADESRTLDTGGSGLGLAICKAFVDAHGGKISAANGPAGGAIFAVTLPDIAH